MNISKDVKDIGTCVVSVLLVPPPIPSRTILASLRMDWDWIGFWIGNVWDVHVTLVLLYTAWE